MHIYTPITASEAAWGSVSCSKIQTGTTNLTINGWPAHSWLSQASICYCYEPTCYLLYHKLGCTGTQVMSSMAFWTICCRAPANCQNCFYRVPQTCWWRCIWLAEPGWYLPSTEVVRMLLFFMHCFSILSYFSLNKQWNVLWFISGCICLIFRPAEEHTAFIMSLWIKC